MSHWRGKEQRGKRGRCGDGKVDREGKGGERCDRSQEYMTRVRVRIGNKTKYIKGNLGNIPTKIHV